MKPTFEPIQPNDFPGVKYCRAVDVPWLMVWVWGIVIGIVAGLAISLLNGPQVLGGILLSAASACLVLFMLNLILGEFRILPVLIHAFGYNKPVKVLAVQLRYLSGNSVVHGYNVRTGEVQQWSFNLVELNADGYFVGYKEGSDGRSQQIWVQDYLEDAVVVVKNLNSGAIYKVLADMHVGQRLLGYMAARQPIEVKSILGLARIDLNSCSTNMELAEASTPVSKLRSQVATAEYQRDVLQYDQHWSSLLPAQQASAYKKRQRARNRVCSKGNGVSLKILTLNASKATYTAQQPFKPMLHHQVQGAVVHCSNPSFQTMNAQEYNAQAHVISLHLEVVPVPNPNNLLPQHLTVEYGLEPDLIYAVQHQTLVPGMQLGSRFELNPKKVFGLRYGR